MYTSQTLQVKWGNSVSRKFNCLNGVKQGGVLSPILFCIYMDELLNKLNNCGVGCFIGNRLVGALCYADDLTLICPSRRAKSLLLNICEDFAVEYYVKFNSTKRYLDTYNVQYDVALKLNNCDIKHVESALHLGHYIGDQHNKKNVNMGIRNINCAMNTMLSRFGYCSSEVKSLLFTSYCTSFCGCPRKCVRRVWGLPYRTHSRYTYVLQNVYPLDVQLKYRFARFMFNANHNNNPIIVSCIV